MDGPAPLWLGLYGALIATAAVCVQYFIWRRTRQERVLVTLEAYVDSAGQFSALVVEGINFSDFAVKATIELKGDHDSFAMLAADRTIESRDRFLEVVSAADLQHGYDFWGNETVTAIAHLPTKKSFASEPVNLDKWAAKDWSRLPP